VGAEAYRGCLIAPLADLWLMAENAAAPAVLLPFWRRAGLSLFIDFDGSRVYSLAEYRGRGNPQKGALVIPYSCIERTTSSFVGPEYRGRGNPQQQQRVLSLFHTDVAQQCTAQQRLR
jgi:hypothetical protein